MPSVIGVSGRCSASAPLLAAGLLPRRLVEEAGSSSSVGAARGHGSVLLRGALPTPVVPRSPTGADGTGLGSRAGAGSCVGSGASLQCTVEPRHPGARCVLRESTRRELCCPARSQAPAAEKAELPGAHPGHLWDLGLCRELAVSVPAQWGRTQEARHGAAWRGSQPRLPHRRLVMLWHMPGRAAALLTVPVRTVQAAAVQHSQRRASQLQQGVVAEVLGTGQSPGCCCGAGAG